MIIYWWCMYWFLRNRNYTHGFPSRDMCFHTLPVKFIGDFKPLTCRQASHNLMLITFLCSSTHPKKLHIQFSVTSNVLLHLPLELYLNHILLIHQSTLKLLLSLMWPGHRDNLMFMRLSAESRLTTTRVNQYIDLIKIMAQINTSASE